MVWSSKNKIKFVVSLLCCAIVMSFYAFFLRHIEGRVGLVHFDPLLAILPSYDLTWSIFALISGVIVATLIHLHNKPAQIILGIQAYTLMVAFRIIVMYFMPFDPPAGMIILKDPLVDLIGASRLPLTRDLFFSGHTATLFLLSLLVIDPRVKRGILFCTAVTAVFLLLQHVHYTVDVVVAPFFAYGSFKLAEQVNSRRAWQN